MPFQLDPGRFLVLAARFLATAAAAVPGSPKWQGPEADEVPRSESGAEQRPSLPLNALR